MNTVIDVAKITSKGQVTIPADVRAAVGVREGDKLLFVRMDDGSITLRSANLETTEAIREGRKAFAGAAKEAGLESEEDLVRLIKRVRSERASSNAGTQG